MITPEAALGLVCNPGKRLTRKSRRLEPSFVVSLCCQLRVDKYEVRTGGGEGKGKVSRASLPKAMLGFFEVISPRFFRHFKYKTKLAGWFPQPLAWLGQCSNSAYRLLESSR